MSHYVVCAFFSFLIPVISATCLRYGPWLIMTLAPSLLLSPMMPPSLSMTVLRHDSEMQNVFFLSSATNAFACHICLVQYSVFCSLCAAHAMVCTIVSTASPKVMLSLMQHVYTPLIAWQRDLLSPFISVQIMSLLCDMSLGGTRIPVLIVLSMHSGMCSLRLVYHVLGHVRCVCTLF